MTLHNRLFIFGGPIQNHLCILGGPIQIPEYKSREEWGFSWAGRAAPRDFPQALPSGNPSEQSYQPLENPSFPPLLLNYPSLSKSDTHREHQADIATYRLNRPRGRFSKNKNQCNFEINNCLSGVGLEYQLFNKKVCGIYKKKCTKRTFLHRYHSL